MKFSKNVNNKKHAPKLIFFNEKKIEKDSDNFWHRKLTLKVRNWLFLITWFRVGVDLTKYFSCEKVLFFTQSSYHLMRKLLKKSKMLSSMYLLTTCTRTGIAYSLCTPTDELIIVKFSQLRCHAFCPCQKFKKPYSSALDFWKIKFDELDF